MKFAGHQTFHLRDNWLHKGLNAINNDSGIFSRPSCAQQLGLGVNMAESLKYWLKATGLVYQSNQKLLMTQVGKKIWEGDRFFEKDETIQVIHYLLCTNRDMATTWYWFFNQFSADEFDRDSLLVYLESFVHVHCEKKIRKTTLEKDIKCLLKMYCDDGKKTINPESDYPSPFLKYGLVSGGHSGRLQKRELMADEIYPLAYVYCIYVFWTRSFPGSISIDIESLFKPEQLPEQNIQLIF